MTFPDPASVSSSQRGVKQEIARLYQRKSRLEGIQWVLLGVGGLAGFALGQRLDLKGFLFLLAVVGGLFLGSIAAHLACGIPLSCTRDRIESLEDREDEQNCNPEIPSP